MWLPREIWMEEVPLQGTRLLGQMDRKKYKIPLAPMGAERRVKRAQTRERGPPPATADIFLYISYASKYHQNTGFHQISATISFFWLSFHIRNVLDYDEIDK